MDATWDIQFTSQFQRDVQKLTKSGFKSWLNDLASLKDGAFQAGVAGFKGASKAFRWRKGDIRVLFRMLPNSHSILLMRAGHRKEIYRKSLNQSSVAVGEYADLVEQNIQNNSEGFRQSTYDLDVSAIAEIEPLFIGEEDIFLLKIPEQYHQAIMSLSGFSDSQFKLLPVNLRNLIEDYVTNPAQNHVGKIYSLESSDEMRAISDRSLSEFLVALDPQQKKIVDRPFKKGPWLVRGGPGTGKTLINIARMKRILEENVGVDLISTSAPKIAFITFNRPLSSTAKTLFDLISRKSNTDVDFYTVDSVIHKIVHESDKIGNTIAKEERQLQLLSKAMKNLTDTNVESRYAEKQFNELGSEFILEEINEVILGAELVNLEDYLDYRRIGRETKLGREQRRFIFSLFSAWTKLMKESGFSSFPARRLGAKRILEAGKSRFFKKYDYLFVDELQDLSVVSIRLLTHFVKYVENIMFTADSAQSIYLKSPSWNNISDRLRFHSGNSFILNKAYRMTSQINEAVAPLRSAAGENEDQGEQNTEVVFTGARPIWVDGPSFRHVETAVKLCQSLIANNGVNPSQIAVITPGKKLNREVADNLNSVGVEYDYVETNRTLDLQRERVHVLHCHVAKGLEFPFVIALGVTADYYPHFMAIKGAHDEIQEQEAMDQERRLLYVALTRASSGLFMISDPSMPSPFLASLDESKWDRVRIGDIL